MTDLIQSIRDVPVTRERGVVSSVRGLRVEVSGLSHALRIGSRVRVLTSVEAPLLCEVIGFEGKTALCLPFGALEGVGTGCPVEAIAGKAALKPSQRWLGRIINGLAQPVDGGPPLPSGPQDYALSNTPPPAHARQRVGERIDLGVRALNTFITCCRGQRMGIFAGSGVGKSVLLSMLARYTDCDVAVIGLIGERGREVQEFIQDDLGADGLARSVVIVATSDESAIMRRQAAYTTLTTAEYFRDQGARVLCLIDSVTRFAMAQREIGLSAGEPPTTKGYPPTVFAELPKLLERAGPGTGDGSITGLFTVLVEGSDFDEPIADAVRGILDGHVVMERSIAERGRYPAINVLKSVSRTMPGCNNEAETQLIGQARRLLSTYADMEELIRLGAYQRGADPEIDEAILYTPKIEEFLSQAKNDKTTIEDCFARLKELLPSDDESPEEAQNLLEHDPETA